MAGGACQDQRATCCSTVATETAVSQRQAVRHLGPNIVVPMARRQPGEMAASSVAPGAPSASSGAAMFMSTRCCAIWPESSASPKASSGHTSEAESATMPSQKKTA